MLLFPPIYSDIMRFIQPSCSLTILGNTLQNYLASCSVDGLRVVMPLQTSLALGSTYLLSLQGLINPSNPSSNVHKYSLEITDSSNGQLLGKSFSPNCNYLMPIFQVNPNPSSSLNYYTQDGLISNI